MCIKWISYREEVANNPDSSLSFSQFGHQDLLQFVLDCVLMQVDCKYLISPAQICFKSVVWIFVM